jgi:hypothetical protein
VGEAGGWGAGCGSTLLVCDAVGWAACVLHDLQTSFAQHLHTHTHCSACSLRYFTETSENSSMMAPRTTARYFW